MKRDVAQRPQTFVSQSVVVFVLQFLAQPDAAQRIGRVLRRNPKPVIRAGRLPIGVATALCYPNAARRPHHRIERRSQSAGRLNDTNAPLAVHMPVRFPVRYGNESNLFHIVEIRSCRPCFVHAVAVGEVGALRAVIGPSSGSEVTIVSHSTFLANENSLCPNRIRTVLRP